VIVDVFRAFIGMFVMCACLFLPQFLLSRLGLGGLARDDCTDGVHCRNCPRCGRKCNDSVKCCPDCRAKLEHVEVNHSHYMLKYSLMALLCRHGKEWPRQYLPNEMQNDEKQ
jgi:hypothetical protein